jgi:D-glycero-D-manno-heptose 1,7-bisphosphate phosphatase
MAKALILLDRDGVLNRMVVDAEHGTIDSPLCPDQVEVPEAVADAVARLTAAGHALAVVTNQPAAAKGKTTRRNLEETHARVLDLACRKGGQILSSHVCFHRAEDGCACRKPNTGLLEEAFARHPVLGRAGAWMVGDGVTDVQAGAALGLRTAFLGPRKCDACKVLSQRNLTPTWWGSDLPAFAAHLLENISGGESRCP